MERDPFSVVEISAGGTGSYLIKNEGQFDPSLDFARENLDRLLQTGDK